MLYLAGPSDPDWIERALAEVDEVLLDHAHCEKKAASNAMNLIFRHGSFGWLVRPMSELAREELEHFERVIALLEARGTPFGPQVPSTYGARLHAAARKAEPHRLLDTLLCSALIEARSCERMKLLAERLTDPELASLYRELLASEARHFQLFVDLADQYVGREASRARLAELAAHEWAVIRDPQGPTRMHE